MNPFSLLTREWSHSTMRFLLSLSLVGLLLATGCKPDPDPTPDPDPNPPPTTPVVAQLAFSRQPQGAGAGVALDPFTVTFLDKDGRAVEVADPVTLSVADGPSGANLPSNVTVPAQRGVATFSNITFTQAGAGYVLQAQSGSLTVRSTQFAITPGPAGALAVTTEPTGAQAGATLSPVRVQVRDGFGNVATNASGEAIVSLVGGGATLSGNTRAAVQQGVASFSELSVDRAGEFRLAFSFSGLTAQSQTFRVTAGTPVALAFTTQPVNGAVGGPLPAVVVSLVDQRGNVATSGSGSVTLALAANPGNAVLGGTTTLAFANGVATFSTLTLDKVGTGYTLRATSGSFPAITSTTFNMTLPVPTRLAFVQQPTSVEAGQRIAPAVTVQVLDTLGRPISSSANILLSLGTNPGGATLSGTKSVNAVNGVATFTDLSLDKAGAGYTLSAVASGLTAATSADFTVRASTPSSLAFAQQPNQVEAGRPITPAVTVRILDGFGNPTADSTVSVTVALGTNPGNGTLSGTRTAVAVNGVATFANLSVDKAAVGYTLQAASSGLTPATSNAFTVRAGAAVKVGFAQQPTYVGVGAVIAPDVKVALQDSLGNTVQGTGSCTVALGANPATAVLGGTKTASMVGGVATFGTLTLDKVGAGYTLVATCGTFPAVTSVPFNVMAASATQLLFVQQPSTVDAGVPFSPEVTVFLLDANGNQTTSNASVTLALNGGTGAALLGTKTVAAVNGVATFGDLAVDKVGTGYTLTASSPSRLTAATSTVFDITAGAPARLGFLQQPGQVVAGSALSPSVTVAVQDAFGNTVTTSSRQVAISLADNPGNGTLSGTRVVSAVSGVATFSDLSVDKAAAGYTLVATTPNSPVLEPAASNRFSVTAAGAAGLAFTVQPADGVAGQALAPAVDVSVVDVFGNPTSSSASVTVALVSNPANATLSGTKTVAAVNGVARFSTLSLDKAATGYVLGATASGLTSATSASFGIRGGPGASIALQVQPANTPAGQVISPAVQVRVTDAFGNPADDRVTVAVASGPTGAALRGTLTVDTVNGVATFSDLALDKAGTGYTLRFSIPSGSATTSTAFAIQSGGASRLVFSRQPSTGAVNVALTPAPQVTIQDALGNPVEGSVQIALGSNPGAATLGGTLTVQTSGGVATFSNLVIGTQASGYTLRATSGVLTVESTAFDVRQVGLVYTDPTVGRVRLVKNPASTRDLLILDLKANEAMQVYSIGFNVPIDEGRVALDGITPGPALSLGTGTQAVAAALPTSGPLKNVLTSVVSQKAAGAGAVTTNTSVAAGTVFYSLRIRLPAQFSQGVAFDGENLGALFHGSVRDRQGNEVQGLGRAAFGIGKLEVSGN